MEQTFLTSVNIAKVRHLQDITIPLSNEKRKHLILTGKNGSGKTSVLNALEQHFLFVVGNFRTKKEIQNLIDICKRQMTEGTGEEGKHVAAKAQETIVHWEREMLYWTSGAHGDCTSFADLREKYAKGQFILAYYKAGRLSKVEISKTIESITLKNTCDFVIPRTSPASY